MAQRLVSDLNNVTNVQIGSKVEKRHNMEPRVMVTVKFCVPAGDISKLGELMFLETKDAPVRVHFYTEALQGSLDVALTEQAAGLKTCPECHGTCECYENDPDNGAQIVTPCAVCHGTGKVTFSITGVTGKIDAEPGPSAAAAIAAEKQFAAGAGSEAPLNPEEEAAARAENDKMWASIDRKDGPQAPVEKPKRRGRKVLPGTAEHKPGQTSKNGGHAAGTEQEAGAAGAGATA